MGWGRIYYRINWPMNLSIFIKKCVHRIRRNSVKIRLLDRVSIYSCIYGFRKSLPMGSGEQDRCSIQSPGSGSYHNGHTNCSVFQWRISYKSYNSISIARLWAEIQPLRCNSETATLFIMPCYFHAPAVFVIKSFIPRSLRHYLTEYFHVAYTAGASLF